MAKFYQHMLPGDTLGKITRLRYIDDVSDDELILYVFEDSSKCDELYIAEINNTQAFGKFVMAELTDPLNAWTFLTKEFKMSKPKTVMGDDGQQYEIPDPGISITRDSNNNYVEGNHTFVSTTEDGIMKPLTMPFDGKRIEATPPRIKNKTVEPRENYLLSLHPELVESSFNEDDNQISTDLLSHSIPTNQKNKALDIDNKNIINTNMHQSKTINTHKSPITTNIIETVKHASIVINMDDLVSSNEYDSVKLINNGEETEMEINEFLEKLIGYKQEKEPEPIKQDLHEDAFISNLIDKSKKGNCTIGIDFELELPPIEVYKTIKSVYSDTLANEFVISLARRMNIDTLKQAVAEGLTMYYNENEPIKNS